MNKTSHLTLGLALITATLGAAEPAAPKFELPAAPTAPAAPHVDASPAQIALARQVIKASQFDHVFDQMGAQMQQMAMQSISMGSPNQTAAQKEVVTKMMGEVIALATESTKSLLANVDVIYAEVYSEAELKAMLGFFNSSEGQSMLNKQPQIMQRLTPFVRSMQQELMPKIQLIVGKAKAAEAAASEASTPNAPSAGPIPLPMPSNASGPAASSPMPSTSTGPIPSPSPSKSTGPMPSPSKSTGPGPLPAPKQ